MQDKITILKSLLGACHRFGDELLFVCPNHECISDGKKKLSINIEKNCYKCWRCSEFGKSVYRLILKYGSYAQVDEWKQLTGQIDITEFDKLLFGTEEAEVTKKEVKLPKEFKTLNTKKLPLSSITPLRYLKKQRDLSKQDILDWRIGYCTEGDYRGRVIIPSFDIDGALNYFVARSFDNHPAKYKNPPASKNVIFNELSVDFSQPVILVEGAFDAIVAGSNAIPILGSTINEGSKLFYALVKHHSTVYLALDYDAKAKTEKIAHLLASYDLDVRIVDIPKDKDVGAMTKQEFTNLLNNSSKQYIVLDFVI